MVVGADSSRAASTPSASVEDAEGARTTTAVSRTSALLTESAALEIAEVATGE